MPRAVLRLLPVLGIWAAAATVLAFPVRRVVDWFVMTDELLYERLAFSVARTGSPLPALHGAHVPVANQLYPVLLSTVVGGDYVPSFLVRAHTLNAVVMTSAAVPAYLLARDVLRSRLAAYAASALAVLVPWLVLASFLLTEVVAYPAFLWGVYLLQRAISRPSPAADTLAIAGLVLALLARTQFFVLVLVAPLAVLAQERDVRRAVDRHRVLAGAAAIGVLVLVVLAAAGRLSSALGTYSSTAHGSLLGASTPRSFLEHAATLSLGVGLLPALLGGAWLSARAVRREAGPAVAMLALVLLVLEVTSFDLRYGGDLPRDRYLFYGAPLLLIGFVGALEDVRLPRWSLTAPLIVVVAGLLVSPLPTFQKLNVDMPAAILDDYLLRSGGGLSGARGLLVACALLLVVIFVVARLVAPRAVVAVILVAATAAALTAETAYAFDRLLRVDGTSGRPITLSQGGVFDWIDRTIGPNENVTLIPYAQIPQDYWATAAYWWDLEFWNRSVTRAAYPENKFAEIQSTFPKIFLTFDAATGRASDSPTRYAAESDFESRFRLRGPTLTVTRDVRLIDAGRRWQADWVSFGLDDDGFTVPGQTATIRVYPAPGQTRPLRRYVSVEVAAHTVEQRATFTTNEGTWPAAVSPQVHGGAQVQLCVPPRGFGTIRLRPLDATQVYGDLGTRAGLSEARVRGVQVVRISLADETGTC